MPLNRESSAVPELFQLPVKTAAIALAAGTFFIVAPIPQLVVCMESTRAMLATAFIGPVCGIIAVAAVLLHTEKQEVLNLFRMNKDDFVFAASATFVIMFSAGLVNVLWKSILLACSIPFEETQFLLNIAMTCSRSDLVLLACLVVLVVPLAEELLFRRVLFAVMLPLGERTAVVGCSAVFAALHLFLAGLPGLFVIGIGFQWLYMRRKNLMVSFFSHSLLNACALCAAVLMRGV